MKLIQIMLFIVCSIHLFPSSALQWKSLTPTMQSQQDGVVITQRVSWVKENQFLVELEVELAQRSIQIEKLDFESAQLLSPYVIDPDPPILTRKEAVKRVGTLQYCLCAAVSFHHESLPYVQQMDEHTFCWDVAKQMQEEGKENVSLSFMIDVDPNGRGYRSNEGNIIQMQSYFTYVKGMNGKILQLQRMYLPAAKVSYQANQT